MLTDEGASNEPEGDRETYCGHRIPRNRNEYVGQIHFRAEEKQ